MKRVLVQDLLDQAQEFHKNGELDKAEKIYHDVLNNNVDNHWIVFLLAQIHLARKQFGIAIYLFRQVVREKPDFLEAWNNLGCALKCLHADESAEFCFKRAMEIDPSHFDFPSNISGIYVNRAQPDKVIEWSDKAIELAGPENDKAPGIVQAKWHKAIALLEKKEFETAWDLHESRIENGSGCDIGVRNYSKDPNTVTPRWDGKSKGLVVIHGEQGLGDEIMFSSCIPDAIKTGAELVFECAPRIGSLMKESFPEIKVIGTHKGNGEEWLGDRTVDFKCAVGTLPKFFRRSIESFPGTPFLKANAALSDSYGARLTELGNRPKIGIAWQGGVIKTRVDLRSVQLKQLLPILSQEADFVSLQYTQMAPLEIEEFFSQSGINIHHWPEAAKGMDMMHQAALVSQLDLVISVCQTCNHVAGGLDIPCWVLTPKWPSWREGVSGDMPWYRSVKLYRQIENWEPVINQMSEDLCLFLKHTESKTSSYTQPILAMA